MSPLYMSSFESSRLEGAAVAQIAGHEDPGPAAAGTAGAEAGSSFAMTDSTGIFQHANLQRAEFFGRLLHRR